MGRVEKPITADLRSWIERQPAFLVATWAERRRPDGIEADRAAKNTVSIDGLPAVGGSSGS
jgi:hypothetical protein